MSDLTTVSRMSRLPHSDDDRRPTTDNRATAAIQESSSLCSAEGQALVHPVSSAQLSSERSPLRGCVQPVAVLTQSERDQMYALLTRYFEDVTNARFAADLAEKEWAILLFDAADQLQGFSTLMRLQISVEDQPVVAFFSGDTIIDRAYWGETALPRLWARHVFGLAEAIRDARVYWFLISSGYKTYRFLPTFFRTFYPTCTAAMPPQIKQIVDRLALLKFPAEYDRTCGVVRLAQATPLRGGVADLTPQRLSDPHVAFFAAANPGHIDGDELACLTEITPANLTPAGRRMLGLRNDYSKG
jgi:hypothetical protein